MKMVYVFLGSIVAAAAVAGVRNMNGSPAAVAEPARITAAVGHAQSPAAMPMEALDEPAAEAITGEVLEVIAVPKYTYLRVGAKGTEGTWVAVPTTTIAVGTRVSVQGAMKMTDFKSTVLARTFPVIFFGTLAGGDAAHGMAPPLGAAASPHGASAADPHAGGAPTSVEVKPVARAAGAGGKTVAEVLGQRAQLNGKTVRVRATVVKLTVGVMGRNYLHLRDGSGDASAGTHDLTVTTEATPAVGETIEIEGNVVTDRDIGSGYKFSTLVEEARILKPL